METTETMTLDQLKIDVEAITEVESCVVIDARNSQFPDWRIIKLEYLYEVQDGRMLTNDFEVLEKGGVIKWYKTKPAVLRESITPREFHKTKAELEADVRSLISGSVEVIGIKQFLNGENDIVQATIAIDETVENAQLICYHNAEGQCEVKFYNHKTK